MNPNRNVQLILASVGELTPISTPVRRLLSVPTWKEEVSKYISSCWVNKPHPTWDEVRKLQNWSGKEQ